MIAIIQKAAVPGSLIAVEAPSMEEAPKLETDRGFPSRTRWRSSTFG